jgi:DNA-binding CsgD family transcriptional regulator
MISPDITPQTPVEALPPLEPTYTMAYTFTPEMKKADRDEIFETMNKRIKEKGHSFELAIINPKDTPSKKTETIQLKNSTPIQAQLRLKILRQDKATMAINPKANSPEDEQIPVYTIVKRAQNANFLVHVLEVHKPKLPPVPKTTPVKSESSGEKRSWIFEKARPTKNPPKYAQKPKEKKLTPEQRKHAVIRSYTLDGKPVADMTLEDRKKAYKKLKLTEDEQIVFELISEGLTRKITDKEIAKALKKGVSSISSFKHRIYRKFMNAGAKPATYLKTKALFWYKK